MPWLSLLGLAGLGAGLVFEAAAVHGLLTASAATAWSSLGLHAVATLMLSPGVYLMLPARYRHPRLGALAFIASSVLFLPGLGVLGMLAALLPGLYIARIRPEPTWAPLETPDLPFRPVTSVAPASTILRDGLATVIAHFEDPKQRQQAITACRHLPRRLAIPLLRQGLTDSSDEVRLLAYAMLNTVERGLDSHILELETAIAQAGDHHGRRSEALAGLYWEYGYLGLAQGSVASYFLDCALTHIDQAIERQPSAQRWLLRGRVCREQGRYDSAQVAFDHCERLGMDDDDIAPQRAELAFRRRRFNEVSAQLHRLSAGASAQPTLRPVMEYWQ